MVEVASVVGTDWVDLTDVVTTDEEAAVVTTDEEVAVENVRRYSVEDLD